MPELSFVNLLIVAAVAVGAPLLLGYLPRLRLPSVVVEVAVLPIARPIRDGCGCPAAGDLTAVPRHCSDHRHADRFHLTDDRCCAGVRWAAFGDDLPGPRGATTSSARGGRGRSGPRGNAF